MNGGSTYCPSCGALLSRNAAICGECGRRLRGYEADRAPGSGPGAWGRVVSAEAAARSATDADDDGAVRIEHVDRAPAPDAPDHTQQRRPSAARSPRPAAGPADQDFAFPLDGCAPAPLPRRVGATVIDSLLQTAAYVPLAIGLFLLLRSQGVTVLTQVLIGVGSALMAGFVILQCYLMAVKGASIGKTLMGLRLTRQDRAGAPGLWRVIGRYLLYAVSWVLPPVGIVLMLSPLFDPLRRGLHDRATGLVLTDRRHGRDPLPPRPEEFDRPPEDFYLAGSAQPVDNPLQFDVAPGAVWNPGGGAGAPVARRDNVPPPQPSAAPPAGSWAPYSAGQVPPGEAYSPYSPPVPDAPVPSRPAVRDAPTTAPVNPWQAPDGHAVPASSPDGAAPSDAGTEIDEETHIAPRRSGVLDGPAATSGPRVMLVVDDGRRHIVRGRALLGRNPDPSAGTGGEELVALRDQTRSLSKTHLALTVGEDGVVVEDLGSTNGVGVILSDGTRRGLPPHVPCPVPVGSTITLGERSLRLEWPGE